MKRREFLTSTSIATAALVAGCGQSTPPSNATTAAAAAAAPATTKMTDVTIDFIGGFAYVHTAGGLVVGSVKTAHHPMHGMELMLVDGGTFTDTTYMPSAKASPAQTNFKHRWILDGQSGAVAGLSGGVKLPSDANKDVLSVPTDWNDLAYLHRLQRYHPGSKVRNDFRDSLMAKLAVAGGNLTVVKPDHPCMEKGIWRGANAKDAQQFLKPIATTVSITGQVAGDLKLAFSANETLTFAPTANGKVHLKVYASSFAPEMVFKKPQAQHHMAMFYELVEDATGKPIPAADQVLPAFESWETADHCAPAGAFIPGEGCSGNFFTA